MNVNDFDKYISSYLDGELRPSEIEKFEKLLNDSNECKQKLKDYKKMLSELSNLEILKTSDDFLDRLHQKISDSKIIKPNTEQTIFGYNYVAISGIAASIGLLIFSISIFTDSSSLPSFNLEKLSTKNVQKKIEDSPSSLNLIAEEDSSIENEEINLPKIHLVGGKK